MPAYRISAVLPSIACCLAVASCSSDGGVAPHSQPDLVFHGGPVLTIENGTADALAVRGNTILAVGEYDAVIAAASGNRQLVDLEGATLLPGFMDGHIHMIRNAGRQGLTGAQAVEMALRHGLTTLVEVAGHMPAIDNLLALEASGELRVRVLAYPDYNGSRPGEDGKSVFVGTWYPGKPPLVDASRRLRIPGIKVYVDGAFSNNRGCYAMTEPYEEEFLQDPSFPCPDPRGSLFLAADELADIIVDAQSAGFQVSMHVIGDRGLDTVLEAIEQVQARTGPSAPRMQIQHTHFLRPDQMPRLLALGVPFSVTAYFHTCEQENWRYHFGDRIEWYANSFALAEAGGRGFVETDFNFGTNPDENRFYGRPLDPLVNLWALVTHREIQTGPVCEPAPWLAAKTVSIERALRMYTLDAAYAYGLDAKLGSLRAGKLADLVILSGDPTAVSPDGLLDLRVLMTMVDGRVEYCAEECPAAIAASVTRSGLGKAPATASFFRGRPVVPE